MTKTELQHEILALKIALAHGNIISQHRKTLERLLARHEALLARMELGVEVRIGVSVGTSGAFVAHGSTGATDMDIQDETVHGSADRMTYVTAWVPRPEPVVVETVEGSVE